MKKIIIQFLPATLLMFLNLNYSIAQTNTAKASLTVNEAAELAQNGAVLIDVRESEELEEVTYKVDNLIHIPLEDLENQLSIIPKDKQVILVCRSGNRSQKAYDFLKEKGYPNLSNMEGGIIAWEEAGFPVIKSKKKIADSGKKSCCADSKSKNCNQDGTCKKSTENKKGCCSSNSKNKKGKSCCTK